MIKIHFDNKDSIRVNCTLEDYIECIKEIQETKYNTIVLDNKVIIEYSKVVYVEEV
ncbi:MAG: hypothetical protein IKU37_01405 [Candidatus Gastranaerophilales bacterium]|nr:hypothetical protein [Candidatus Gastranaerophilales bacterium]